MEVLTDYLSSSHPRASEALVARAAALVRLGDFEAGLRDALECVRLVPGEPKGHSLAGACYLALCQLVSDTRARCAHTNARTTHTHKHIPA